MAAKTVTMEYHGPQALLVELGREVVDGDTFEAPAELVEKLVQAGGVTRKGEKPPEPDEPADDPAAAPADEEEAATEDEGKGK